MRTFDEYKEKLKKMRHNIFLGGKLVGRDNHELQGGINLIGTTFKAAFDPRFEELATATSHLTGKKINRFCHLYKDTQDLLKRQEMERKLCSEVGGCIQRCMGTDTINALAVVTKEMDEEYGTEYYPKFMKYLAYFEENDIVACTAQTDVKGDRSKRPAEQEDKDMYLRVVEKREDGIVVSGCKAHNSTAPYTDEIFVLPTRAMVKDEADWAVAFAIPSDTEGIHMIARVTGPRERKELKAPYNELGLADSMTVFDNVFVPWERVFMCGETKYAARLALAFANNHRFSYCGCKPASTEIFLGATALVADYNGVGKASHVKEELAEMMVMAELVYAAGIAAAVTATKSSSGVLEPNFMYTNCGRYYAGENLYHEYNILCSVAGGLPATLPYEEEWINDESKKYLEKYMIRKPGVSAEDQYRLFRFISDFSCSAWAGVGQYGGVHGGGSPVMERIGIRSIYDLQPKIDLVKRLAGIK